MSEVRLAVEPRTEFGKGAARRSRRDGRIPAVLHGHGTDPQHLSLPALEFARVVRKHGQNAVLTLDIAQGGTELALTKTITAHPIKDYIQHVDLLLVQRGEKVTVEVPVVLSGTAASGTLVNQELTTLEVQAEALHIPEQIELSIEGAQQGTQISAGQVSLPSGVTLSGNADILVVNIVTAPTAEQMEAEGGATPVTTEATEEEASAES